MAGPSKPIAPGTYLNLALFAFALLGLELVLELFHPLFPFAPASLGTPAN